MVREERYNEAEKLTIVGSLTLDTEAKDAEHDDSHVVIQYGPGSKPEAIINFSPFSVDFKRDGVPQIKLNEHGLFNVDHWRPEIEKFVEQPAKAKEQKRIETEIKKSRR